MVISYRNINPGIKEKAKKIKLLLTDSDGVLTDTGVYYSEKGEELKRFSIRDGMGVERLRELAGVESGIITGEISGSVRARAEKLKLIEIYEGVKDKLSVVRELSHKYSLEASNIAYIGDDTNDIEVLKFSGLSGCPADAVIQIKQIVDYITENKGGFGAFRDFAELIIASKNS